MCFLAACVLKSGDSKNFKKIPYTSWMCGQAVSSAKSSASKSKLSCPGEICGDGIVLKRLMVNYI